MPHYEALLRSLHEADVFLRVVGLLLVPSVLVRRKEPSATIAWILVLLLLPAVGALLFLLFGRDRVRWPAQRKRQLDAVVRAQVRNAAPDLADASRTSHLTVGSSLEQGLFRVAQHLTHLRATSGNRVDVLAVGDAAYQAIGDAIDAAQHHVHAQYYLIRDDATGRWFRERLVAAAKRGVHVRLLMDGFGCFALGRAYKRPLHQAGVEVAEFLPMRSVLLQPVNLRNHRKIVVVDGTTSFTGGLNVGDEYRGHMAGLGSWRDVHLRIRGPASSELQRVFFQDWAFATGTFIPPEGYFPQSDAPEGAATVAIVPSGPDTRTEAIHRLFVGAISGATREVAITTPYFVPNESLRVALELAAMRGVRVRLILPSKSNHAVTFHAGRGFYAPLIEAGVEVCEYEPGIVHAKTLIADSQVALVGSANMDLRSFRLNFEVHTLVHDGSTAAALHEAFENDAAQSRIVRSEAWAVRGWGPRVKEGASRLVSPLL
jgi:cardiolipin synthase